MDLTLKEISEEDFIKEFESLNLSLKKDDFITVSKKNLTLIILLLSRTKDDKKKYNELIEKYFIPIMNKILKKIPTFIDKNLNIYNNDFITILKCLYHDFYINFENMRNIFDKKERKELSLKLLKEYYLYSYELLLITPAFDEITRKKYDKENSLIIFDIDEKKYLEMNLMKSKIIQFFSYIVQNSTLDDNPDNNIINCENKNDLIIYINRINNLILNSFEDILKNKEKLICLKKTKYFEEPINYENDNYISLSFQMCVFLTRSLIREPIKTQFSSKMENILLNILFPINIIIDDEINYLEKAPEKYNNYINNLISDFSFKSFTTSLCFLIKKICEKYELINFILSFNIGMLNYIFSGGKNKNELDEYNIYLQKITNSLINSYSDEVKIDLSLLNILIMKEYLKKNYYFVNSLGNIFIKNQEKIISIKSPIIRFKLCKLFGIFIEIYLENIEDDIDDIKIKFIEMIFSFLLNNIIQNIFQDKDNYKQALSLVASDTIIELLKFPKDTEKNGFQLFKIISEKINTNFSVMNLLIKEIDVNSFYILIEKIISEIKINQRNLLFECLNNLLIKFQKNNNEEFQNQFFYILRSFLTGVNKININDKEEIKIYEEILDNIINLFKNENYAELFDEIIKTTEFYIKELNEINNKSIIILKQIKIYLDEKKNISLNCLNFLLTFMSIIKKDNANDKYDLDELINEIIIIIKKSSSFNIDNYNDEQFTYPLFLALKILSLNPNLNEENLQIVLNNSINTLKLLNSPEDLNIENSQIIQLSLANISLGFIYYPDITIKVLNPNYFSDKNLENSLFEKYIIFIKKIIDLNYPYYNYMLGKLIFLGICGIFTNIIILNYINNYKDKNIKIFLLSSFCGLLINHKKQKITFLNQLMKNLLYSNFVGQEDEEDDDYEDDEYIKDFNEKVEYILKDNNEIIKSDEFKLFEQIIKYIKKNDENTYNEIINNFGGKNLNIIESLFRVRNITVKYEEKEYNAPRIILKIKKNGENKN